MTMLLDTCALIWIAQGGGELTAETQKAVDDADCVYVSSISAFEIAHKYKKGGIELPCDPERWFYQVIEKHNILEIQIDGRITIASTKLYDHHNDPCDRFIIATAILNRFQVVTHDRTFKKYGLALLR